VQSYFFAVRSMLYAQYSVFLVLDFFLLLEVIRG